MSYAREDKKLKKDILKRLKTRLDCAKEYSFVCWEDGEILAGEDWNREIQQAIEGCHFGLLLLSYAFLRSRFITAHELPQFISKDQAVAWRRAVPVGLSSVPFDGSVDLKGLQQLQVFRDSEGKFYSQRAAETTKEQFAEELFQQILALARRHIAPSPVRPSPEVSRSSSMHRVEGLAVMLARRQHDALIEPEYCAGFIPTEVMPADLSKLREDAPPPETAGERRDALEFLLDWAAKPQSPPYCTLLGDYGMGKTTTCKALTRRLLEAREGKRDLPLPIYLDLRHLGTVRVVPILSKILETVLRKSWQVPEDVTEVDPKEVIRLVQDEGALAIFDGLDEVLVRLSPADGQQFTREIWRILPPSLFGRTRGKEQDSGKRRGKLLVSCRTHYFRTLRDQATHFTGEDREGLSAPDYRALVLLPFTEAQVEQYFRQNLPEQDTERLLDLIRSVHNLPELAERPYTLSLIARHIPDLERWKAEGRRVTGVTLYRHMVLSWLERDQGKHQLRPEHKQRLMEHLAAALWRSGKRAWSVDDLEQWLVDFLVGNPRIAANYEGKDRELLKEDLRTATFLVRQGEQEFRFAHTSLQEFFLAAYLHRALHERRPDDWALPVPSPETLDFLGQLLAESDGDAALKVLREIRGAYRPGASELALAYGLRAHQREWPRVALAGFRLEGADLRGWRFEGDPERPAISLNGAVFRGTRLEGAVFRHVSLDRADFSGARLERAELLGKRAQGTAFAGADLTGTVFRNLDLEGADFSGADLHRSQWLGCRLAGVQGLSPDAPGALVALGTPSRWTSPLAPSLRLAVFTGHQGPVNGCAWSPDGRRLASAGEDGTLRLWDPDTGQEMGPRIHYLGAGEVAVISLAERKVLGASPGAWRWLGWLAPDPATGEITRYPAEVFGPLPPLAAG